MQKHFYWKLIILIAISSLFAFSDNNISSFLKSIKQNNDKILSVFSKKDHSYINMKFINDAKKQSYKKEPTIFYLFSQDMKMIAIKRFAYAIKQLKKKDPDLKGYVVFKGFPKKSFWFKLKNSVYTKDLKNTIVFKVHPYIYRYYKADMVPAYIFAYCPSDFRFKECELKNSYIARGDFSLEYFFDLLKDQDKRFKKYYYELSEVK